MISRVAAKTKYIKQVFGILGAKGVYSAIAAKRSGRIVVQTVKHPTLRNPVSLRLPTTDISTYDQVLTCTAYQFDINYSPEVIVDAGANIGLTTAFLATRFPKARIYSIEAEHSNFEMLRENTRAYENVTPIYAALADSPGEVAILDDGSGHWAFRIQKNAAPTQRKVRAITMDGFMEEYKISHVDVLKVDIEGAEYDVFRASKSWLGRMRSMVVETHEHFVPGGEKVFGPATASFPYRWKQGENDFFTRPDGCIKAPAGVAPRATS